MDLIGLGKYANAYTMTLQLVASGRVDVTPLVTRHFPIIKVASTFQVCRAGAAGAIKVMVDIA